MDELKLRRNYITDPPLTARLIKYTNHKLMVPFVDEVKKTLRETDMDFE